MINYAKGEVADRLGCIKASEHHEVVVYEDRGENLSFLKVHDWNTATDSWGHPIPTSISGSERVQKKEADKEEANPPARVRAAGGSKLAELVNAFSMAAQSLVGKPSEPTRGRAKAEVNPIPEPLKVARTRADMGQVSPPSLKPAVSPSDHVANAFLEFLALTRASREVNLQTCKKILQTFEQGNESLLKVLLEEAEAAVYNNDNFQVIQGTMSGSYMAAYNATSGFVVQREDETDRTEKPNFVTPVSDPIVVVARCTKIMLDDKILEKVKTLSGCQEADWKHWTIPNIRWINGVPGRGKTTWVVKNFNVDKDTIITSTTEAANDLNDKLALRIGDQAKTKVRTMASVLVNGFRELDKSYRLTIDEALMNHFGAIIMASRLSGAGEIVLIGDVNQLPYIDRNNLFEIRYNRPNLIANISQELLCTHRNPMDVAYALREVYSGIYSSKPIVSSLKLKRYNGEQIPSDLSDTLFLVHTQEEKVTLSNQGYGGGTESRTLTIHEAQGLSYESVIIINTWCKMKLHESVPLAVVAISRHTNSCTYYTDDTKDTIGRFIERAMAASTKAIIDYNLKMAIKDRNAAVGQALACLSRKEAEIGGG
ncbi:Replicase large subunit [Operophtera brumata]|uniref:Replicase large subunit n=1 Tax=Operophtera brumata TaxID=104452 RepID=A0A0L7L2W3_OPEBR|nr:Replicase large subunit [Operophtera brumata]